MRCQVECAVSSMHTSLQLHEADSRGWRRCSFLLEADPHHDRVVAVGLVVACQELEELEHTPPGGSAAELDVSLHVGCLLLCNPSGCTEAVPAGLQLEGPIQRSSKDAPDTLSCCLRWEMPGTIPADV